MPHLPRFQRWALLLEGYDYSIRYKSGGQHANADLFSRLPLPDSVPVLPETVMLMESLSSSPVTAAQIVRLSFRGEGSLVLLCHTVGWKSGLSSC